jgi:hypothetical protein
MKKEREQEIVTVNINGVSPLLDQVEKTKPRSKSYVMDLRVHSPATIGYSGFSGLDSAPAIVRLAKVKGLDVIAITDLFSADFVDRMVSAAKGSALTVIPGVGIRCRVGGCNDVILSCLFSEDTDAECIRGFLRDLCVPMAGIDRETYVVSKTLDEILHILERYQGIAIPSRLDKTPYRSAVIPELVETYGFRAFDLAYADTASTFKKRWPKTSFKLFSFSDANALAQIGSRIATVKLVAPGFDGIRQVVAREGAALSA